ncbi:MAG: TrkH family potassium uptake protein [Phycisphaerales bacterium]|nr:TrkH family potassium uptake protein [Phycisphaerales bacterium]
MNSRVVLGQLSKVITLMGLILLAIGGWALLVPFEEGLDEDYAEKALLLSSGCALIIGLTTWLLTLGPRDIRRTLIRGQVEGVESGQRLGRRDALLLVSASWIVGAVFVALPYLFWAHIDDASPANHPFRSLIDCYFESMSGLSTTGATVLLDIEALPSTLLFWRSLSQWLGGLGILVLLVALLPNTGVTAKRMFRFEAPGPDAEGVRPTMRDTARRLWTMYLVLTALQVICLLIAGMGVFDSFCHTFTTLATGGFSTRGRSMAGPETVGIQIIVIVFMVLAGTNFGVLHMIMRRQWKKLWADTELRVYLSILFIGCGIVVASLLVNGGTMFYIDDTQATITAGNATLEGVFTVVSQQSTTGFTTVDYNVWPFVAKSVIIAVMFIGGCAGSTAGGIKVVRIWITLRVIWHQLTRVTNPAVVRPIRISKQALEPEQMIGAVTYTFTIVLLFALGAIIIQILEQDQCGFVTSATASLATLCTVGPGLNQVGAIEDYAWFSDGSKLFMCFLMLVGRLELFAVFALFQPRFWTGR